MKINHILFYLIVGILSHLSFAQSYAEGMDLSNSLPGSTFIASGSSITISGTVHQPEDVTDLFTIEVPCGCQLTGVSYSIGSDAGFPAGAFQFGTNNQVFFGGPTSGSFANASESPTVPFPVGQGTYEAGIVASNAPGNSWSMTFTTSCTIISLPLSSQTNVSCFGGSNGAASVTAATGGTGPYTYDWTPGNPVGDGTTSVTGLTAGVWTCTVTDAIGCTKATSFTVTQPSAIVATAASQTNVSCFGGSNGAASINAAIGGTGPYTYDWTPGNPVGDGTTSVSGLTAGPWTCTVTDFNGCTKSTAFAVTQLSDIVITAASQTNVSCFGGTNGAASINIPTGGAGGYSYNWTPGNPVGDGTRSVTGLPAGPWTCTVTDFYGCTKTTSFTITQAANIVVTVATQSNVSCFGGSNGVASINTPTGGTGAYTYNWSPGNPVGDGTTSVSGLTALTWFCTVTDANGCVGSQNIPITQPSAIVVTAASQTDVSCSGGANGTVSINTPSGGTGPYTYDWTPGDPLGDGTTSISGLTAGAWTCTVTDFYGCTKSAEFTLITSDVTPPTAVCQNINVYLNGAGLASIVAADLDGGSTDNCGGVTLSASQTTFNCSNIGTNNVTLTVTDGTSNTATCVAVVTVLDTIAPVAICQNFTSYLDGSGTALVFSGMVDGGSVDNCGIGGMSSSPALFNCSNVGPNNVTFTVTDISGNIATCTSIVTIVDTISPVAICQNINAYIDGAGNATLVAADVDGGSVDNCGGVTLSASQTSFTCANSGANNVTLTVADASGNSSTCMSVVTVLDTISPTTVCQNSSVYLDGAGNATLVAADLDGGSTDNCGGVTFIASQTLFTCTNVGANNVTLTVTDGGSNTSTCVAVVTVVDTISPVADLASLPNLTDVCSVTSLTAPTATDNCAGTVTVTHDATLPITSSTTVTWTYDDGNGNTLTQTQDVFITDNIAPVADVATLLDITDECSVTALTAPTATDNCAGTVTVTNDAILPITTQGTTVVTWTYADVNGNTSTQTQAVVISDVSVPVADVATLLDITDECSVTALIAPIATDNCAGTVIVTNNVTLPITSSATITWTYDDGNGNTSTQTQEVIITPIDNGITQVDPITLSADVAGYNYQWIDCGNGNQAIVGETGQTFSATANGNYAVEIDNGDCMVTSNCVIIDPVGITKIETSTVDVYPNPTDDVVLVSSEVPFTKIEVLNAMGQKVQSLEMNNTVNYSLKLPVECGVYMIKIYVNDLLTVKRIVKR